MSPKEKAEEIVNELFERSLAYHDSVIAAKFLTEQIIDVLKEGIKSEGGFYNGIDFVREWEEVKTEIEKL